MVTSAMGCSATLLCGERSRIVNLVFFQMIVDGLPQLPGSDPSRFRIVALEVQANHTSPLRKSCATGFFSASLADFGFALSGRHGKMHTTKAKKTTIADAYRELIKKNESKSSITTKNRNKIKLHQ